ncbi:MAG: succinate dehydrogenase, cytochrome b556 subunit [Gammaproteobacteria bacterium]|nr:succinate dehydrogenase, cytochrome b556 subunit [Gammaproteobacteria bacterium]MCP4980213.1 succinate dehydrogenase, cytochrome b556 subunit [Gammaproteobacteria bacterium]
MKAHRKQPLYLAFLLHRISGLGLALFLPLHFYVLGLSLQGGAMLDRFLHWSQQPLMKFVEFGLVFLLALHFFGGLRLLALENMPWSNQQKNYAALAVAAAFFVAGGFLLRAF